MGFETLAEGREMMPVIKSEGQSNNQHRKHNIANFFNFNNYIEKEKCLGVDPNLHEHVFKATKNGDLYCDTEGQMCTQPDINSLMDRSSTPSKAVGIPNTWLLLDSQSIIDVVSNGDLLTQLSKKK